MNGMGCTGEAGQTGGEGRGGGGAVFESTS